MEPLCLLAATTRSEDPTVPAWITTAAYLWLAMLCTWTWWRDRATRRPRRPLGSPVWLGLAILFAALGVAKPFALQAMLTESMRKRAVEGDWYAMRREYQFAFILVAGSLAAIGAVALVWLAARKTSWRNLSALAPVVLLLGFLGVRATSLHDIDAVLYATVAGVRWNTVIELTILGLVALALTHQAEGDRRGSARNESAGAGRYTIPGAGPFSR